MYFAYLFLFLVAIFFKLFHWPGVSLILIFTPILGLSDIIIQAIRKKGDKETNVLSAVALLFLALFFQFKFLSWPGSIVLFIVASLLCTIFLFRFISKKLKKTYRFYILTFLFLFGILNVSLKKSQFTLFYMLEDPFDKTQPVPHFVVQRLAYYLYQEGEKEKAKLLIERNIEHLENLRSIQNTPDFLKQIDSLNLEISKRDLFQINSNTWKMEESLFPEDRQINN
jgi:hypothetical protein